MDGKTEWLSATPPSRTLPAGTAVSVVARNSVPRKAGADRRAFIHAPCGLLRGGRSGRMHGLCGGLTPCEREVEEMRVIAEESGDECYCKNFFHFGAFLLVSRE